MSRSTSDPEYAQQERIGWFTYAAAFVLIWAYGLWDGAVEMLKHWEAEILKLRN